MSNETASYVRIKIHSWYRNLKKGADKEVLENAQNEVKKWQDRIKNIGTVKCENTIGSLVFAEKKLSTAKTKGASLDEVADYVFNVEKTLNFDINVTKTTLKIDKDDPDEIPEVIYRGDCERIGWGKFSNGKQDPTLTNKKTKTPVIDRLTVLFPKSRAAFFDGPALIFQVFETVNLRDAVDAYLQSILFVLKESVEEGLLDKVFADELVCQFNSIKYPTGKKSSEFIKFMNYNDIMSFSTDVVTGEINGVSLGLKACLDIANAYIHSKYLGDSAKLARCCFVSNELDLVEACFAIPKKNWFDLEVTEPFKILEEFVEAKKHYDNDNILREFG